LGDGGAERYILFQMVVYLLALKELSQLVLAVIGIHFVSFLSVTQAYFTAQDRVKGSPLVSNSLKNKNIFKKIKKSNKKRPILRSAFFVGASGQYLPARYVIFCYGIYIALLLCRVAVTRKQDPHLVEHKLKL
jgi:hypothetical protein